MLSTLVTPMPVFAILRRHADYTSNIFNLRMYPKSIYFFSFLASILLPLAASARENLLEYLPAEIFVSAEFDDIGAILENLEEGPLGELWNSKAGKKLRERFPGVSNENNEKNPEIKELLDRLKTWSGKLSGHTVFAFDLPLELLNPDKVKTVLNNEPDELLADLNVSGLQILAEVKDANLEDLEEFVLWFEETTNERDNVSQQLRVEKTRRKGDRVFWLAPEKSWDAEDGRIGVFLVDGILGLGTGVSNVEDMIDRIGGGSDGKSQAENIVYREAFDEIGKGDARVFINFPPFYKALIAMMEGRQKAEEDLAAKNDGKPKNAFVITPQKVMSSLGLSGLQSIALQVDLDKRGFEMGFGIFCSRRNGLLKLLPNPNDPVNLVHLIPRDVESASIMRFDLVQLWDTFLEILNGLNPGFTPLVNLQLGLIEKKAGVSLREDVLGSLDTEVFTFSEASSLIVVEDSEPSENEESDPHSHALKLGLPEGFYAIALKDADRFDRSLRAWIGALMPGAELFKDHEHKGVLVRTMSGEDVSFTYAVTPKWLFLNLGEPARMLQTIDRLENPRKTLWRNPVIADALADLPDEVHGVEYSDLEVLSGLMSDLMIGFFKEVTDEKMDKKDLPKLPYFMLGWTRGLPNGMVGHNRLYRKSEDE
jgi:hypothetical protein